MSDLFATLPLIPAGYHFRFSLLSLDFMVFNRQERYFEQSQKSCSLFNALVNSRRLSSGASQRRMTTEQKEEVKERTFLL